jgi:hypothetical protein
MFAQKTCEAFRTSPNAFTRKRLLNFAKVVVLMLSGHKFSLQNALNKFFSRIGAVFSTPTASAYCQAKQKVKAEIFVHLNEVLVQDFYQLYEADKQVLRWRGHRLLGADGTHLNVPDNEQTRNVFSLHHNQKTSDKSSRLQALGMVLYDLLNDIGIKGALTKSHCGENDLMFEQLWSATKEDDVLVLDRGKASFYLVAKALKEKRHLIMRMPRGKSAVVDEFFKSEEKEAWVKLRVTPRSKTAEKVKAEQLAEEVEVRLVKFELASGEQEVLLTTLLDREKYPREEFYQVYGSRWGDETYYDRIKNVFEVERVSGQSEEAIKQDYYGVIFLASLESVLSKEVEEEMKESGERQRCEQEAKAKAELQVNHAVSYVALVERVGSLLADEEKSLEEVMKELEYLFRQNATRKRKGRKYPREVLSHARKLQYYRYKKRIIA